ncbi:MAG: hypothetical protein ABH827_01390 [bacterium]
MRRCLAFLIYGIYGGCYDRSGLIYQQGDVAQPLARLSRYLSQNTAILSKQWVPERGAKEISGEQAQADFFITLYAVQKWKDLVKAKK